MVTMIELVQFAPAFGLPNASRFCMKMETCLRMAGLPFELVNSGDVMKAPKHKLPYIDDGGAIVADTGFIIDRKPFMLGEQPTSLDATAYAFLANLLWAPVDSPIQRHAQARPTLEACCRRMKARYFG